MIPRHTYDRNYVPVPDAPEASMLDVSRLPEEVQHGLRAAREHEAQGAVWPTLLADPVRAWFRYQERSRSFRETRLASETDQPKETT